MQLLTRSLLSRLILSRLVLGTSIAMGLFLSAHAQDPARQPVRSPTASVPLTPPPDGGLRQLAPGVMHEVPIEPDEGDTYSRHDVVELLKVDPDFDWAKDIRFEHPIWQLEFSYKPVRFVDVDIPTPEGRLQRKRVWYMIYKVRNPGTEPVEFYPWIVLESTDPDVPKAYPDRLIPVALPAIAAREDRNRRFSSTVDIAGSIPPSGPGEDGSVWGVATWSDLDPRIDSFAIYIAGLTNAYRWEDDPEQGRSFTRKMLELNFWRPGDEYHEREGRIRVGTPDRPDYQWVFR